MRNIKKFTKPELKSLITKAVIGAQATYAAFTLGMMQAHAEFKKYSVSNQAAEDPTSAFFSLAFDVLKIVGGGLFLFGIVGIVTARSDGDSSQIMNQVGKLAGGAVLMGLPIILSTAGILN